MVYKRTTRFVTLTKPFSVCMRCKIKNYTSATQINRRSVLFSVGEKYTTTNLLYKRTFETILIVIKKYFLKTGQWNRPNWDLNNKYTVKKRAFEEHASIIESCILQSKETRNCLVSFMWILIYFCANWQVIYQKCSERQLLQ